MSDQPPQQLVQDPLLQRPFPQLREYEDPKLRRKALISALEQSPYTLSDANIIPYLQKVLNLENAQTEFLGFCAEVYAEVGREMVRNSETTVTEKVLKTVGEKLGISSQMAHDLNSIQRTIVVSDDNYKEI